MFLFPSDSEFEEMDGPHIHFRPEALETLCQLTKFTKREIQMMYRGFKQVSIICFAFYWGLVFRNVCSPMFA